MGCCCSKTGRNQETAPVNTTSSASTRNRTPSTMSVQEIKTKEAFDALLKDATGLVVVDFHATWCGPCKILAPFIEGLAKEHTSVTFAKIDVDEVSDVAEEQGISAMPTIIFFKNQEKVHTVVGANKEEIKKTVEAKK